MKFARPLDDLLGQRSKVALLRFLVRTRGEHNGSELSRLLALDAKTCHTALQDLASQGVVHLRRMGKSIAYSLNDRHVLVSKILAPMFEKERGLLEAYAVEVRQRAKIPLISVILFGSVARGEERSKSDVDLLFITREGKGDQKALDEAASDLATTYGNPPQVLLLTIAQFSKKARTGDPFISEVLRTGRILFGKPIPELLKHGA